MIIETGRIVRTTIFPAKKEGKFGQALVTIAIPRSYKSFNPKTNQEEYMADFVEFTEFPRSEKDLERIKNTYVTGTLVEVQAHFNSSQKDGKYYVSNVIDNVKYIGKKVEDPTPDKMPKVMDASMNTSAPSNPVPPQSPEIEGFEGMASWTEVAPQ